ncbi:MAG: fumarylacetoacetate hydrolase family protein [Chloroflexi bacterium]|nr:fumarylacetoacetate hydrolase family protein [Chloroflexota bacterium]
MKLLRFSANGSPARYGLVEGDTVVTIDGDPMGEFSPNGQQFSLGDVKILPPCTPSKIVAVGYNYVGHADELKEIQPFDPLIFLKAPTALVAHGEPIVRPAITQRLSHEAELAVIIGKTAKNVEPEDALQYVFGYTCGNDLTDRDLQKKEVQYARSKSFDSFCPLGPFVAPGLAPSDLKVESRVNGEVRQSSSTKLLIHSVPKLISWISKSMTLLPGDVILTGTPPGVGLLEPGDVVEIEVGGVGTLRNPVVAER